MTTQPINIQKIQELYQSPKALTRLLVSQLIPRMTSGNLEPANVEVTEHGISISIPSGWYLVDTDGNATLIMGEQETGVLVSSDLVNQLLLEALEIRDWDLSQAFWRDISRLAPLEVTVTDSLHNRTVVGELTCQHNDDLSVTLRHKGIRGGWEFFEVGDSTTPADLDYRISLSLSE